MAKELPTNGDLLDPGERWATPIEAEEFWTEQRLSIAKRVYESMNWRLMETFDGPEALPFSSKAFLLKITEEKDKVQYSGALHPSSGWIMLDISDKDDDRWLAQVVAHEVGESRAHRLSHYRPECAFIDEAVIETTMQRFLYDEWPQLKDDPDPVTYSLARKATTAMCKRIFHALPDKFAYPHQVFELLQKAIFENQNNDFFDVFALAYGTRGLDMLRQLGNFGGTVDLHDVRSGNVERYKWLLKFLQGEDIELWKANEAIAAKIREEEEREQLLQQRKEEERKRYERTHAPREVVKDKEGRAIQERFIVNGRIIEVDYTQVPEDVPVEDNPHETSFHKWGVRTVVGRVIDNIYSLLNGGSIRLLSTGKLPEARRYYIPTESDIMYRRIENAAHQLLTLALDVQKQPSYEHLHANKHDKAEFHEAAHLGELASGKRLYFLYVYRTQKVRKSDERKVLRDSAQVHAIIMTPKQIEEWVAERRLWY